MVRVTAGLAANHGLGPPAARSRSCVLAGNALPLHVQDVICCLKGHVMNIARPHMFRSVVVAAVAAATASVMTATIVSATVEDSKVSVRKQLSRVDLHPAPGNPKGMSYSPSSYFAEVVINGHTCYVAFSPGDGRSVDTTSLSCP